MDLLELVKDPKVLKNIVDKTDETRNLPVTIEIELKNPSGAKEEVHKSKVTINLYELLHPYLLIIDELNDEVSRLKGEV